MTYQEPLKLFRVDLSPYQAQNYAQVEKAFLQEKGFIWANDVSDTDILITNTHTKLSRYKTSDFSKLKLVIHPNSGYDNFSVDEISALPCPMVIGNRIRSHAVSHYILASLFHAVGMPPWKHEWDPKRAWNRRSIESLHVQIIGYGHIGKTLAHFLEQTCKQVSIFDPYQNLNDLKLADCDALLFACSLNPKNVHFLNAQNLATMKNDSIIINAARGKLIDQKALIDWLKINPCASAYLDVFEEEPTDLSIFPTNAFCSSHLAGVDHALDQRIMNFVATVATDFSTLRSDTFTQKWHDSILAHRIVDNHFI